MNEQPPLKNLALKMIQIMSEVKCIQKNGFNQFHKYKYATETDVSSAFSSAMQKHQVFMFSSILDRECHPYQTRGNKEAFLITVKLQVTFIDAESGESFTSTFYGDGSDSDDKGVYKAITGAQKYALMKTFLAATGDDPERDERSSSAPKQTPVVTEQEKKLLMTQMEAKARQGTLVFREAWKLLSAEQRKLLQPRMSMFHRLATEADPVQTDPVINEESSE